MTFPWAHPDHVEQDEAGTLGLNGWVKYQADRVPALWRRISDAWEEPDGWLFVFKAYGPLARDFGPTAPEARVRDGWKHTLGGLMTVAALWQETSSDGIFEMPSSAPLELTGAYRLLQSELSRMIGDASVRLAIRGLDLVSVPVSLEGYLWLTAAEAVREKHRFRRCERCQAWMRIQRTDARFCSAVCRNKRDAAG